MSGELKDVWNAVQALRDKQRADNHYATQENLVLYTEFGPESAPPLYQQQQQQQQRETVIQYSGQSAIRNNTNNGIQSDDAITLKDHMEKISSETENMRISPTEPCKNKGENNESQTMHDTQTTQTLPINNPTTTTTTTIASPTSVIVSTGNVTVNGGGQPSPTNHKKDSSSHNYSSSSSFLTKFRSSKTSSQNNHQTNQPDATAVQDVNNKKDADNGENHQQHLPHQQSKHKKFLSYIRRKAGTKNDNCTNRDSRKGINGDNTNTVANNVTTVTTTGNNHNGNNEDSNTTSDLGKQEIMEASIIDAK